MLAEDPNAAEGALMLPTKSKQELTCHAVVKISTGQLYLVRPGNIRSSRECMFVSTCRHCCRILMQSQL